MRHPSLQALLVLLSLTSLAQSSYAQIAAEPSPFTSDNPNAVVPGELFTEPPTLINLGFEWLIQGDENRNARVEVWCRNRRSKLARRPTHAQAEWRAHLQ